jgi:hypothetical protein
MELQEQELKKNCSHATSESLAPQGKHTCTSGGIKVNYLNQTTTLWPTGAEFRAPLHSGERRKPEDEAADEETGKAQAMARPQQLPLVLTKGEDGQRGGPSEEEEEEKGGGEVVWCFS